jgi:2-methylisocitrate lyase-like PEP mutase family enzyme
VMTRNDKAAPEAAVPIVINARIDIYLKQIGDPASRFAETVRRAEAYLAPGADCIFPFAVTDADTSGRLTWAIQASINIVGRAGTPDLATLERLGVKRVSTASSLTMMAIDGPGASQARKLGEQRLHLLNAWEARRFPAGK